MAKLVSNDDVLKNNCNLSVSGYVEQEDTREKIDIAEVNKSLVDIVKTVNRLRTEVDQIIAEL